MRRLHFPLACITLLVIGLSCDRPSTVLVPDEPTRSAPAGVLDGANGGTPGFYFLPPTAQKKPAYSGAFDGSLLSELRVEICEVRAAVCAGAPVATLTSAASADGSTISVNRARESYEVYWRVGSSLKPDGRTFRATVSGGGTLLGYIDIVHPQADAWIPISFRVEQGAVVPNTPPQLVAPSSLNNTAPIVTISAPQNGAIVQAGSPVTFLGVASDLEDGDVTASLQWVSDRQGAIGTGGSFTVTLSGGTHTITATATDAGGSTGSASITLTVSIITLPASLNVSYAGTASLPITLTEPAPAGGLALSVVSADPSRVSVGTPTVFIPAGAMAATATLNGVASGTSIVTVSHTMYGMAQTSVTTGAAPNISIAAPNVRVGSGLMSIGANYLFLSIAQHGGVTVRLASGNANLVKVGPNDSTIVGTDYVDLFVPDGQQYAYYSLHGIEGQTGTTSVTASAPGFTSATASGMDVVPVAFQLHNVPGTLTTTSNNGEFYARVGASSAADVNSIDNGGKAVQPVRPGGTALTVNVSNSDSTVGQLQIVGGAAAQTATLSIVPGHAFTPHAGAVGAVQFDPLGPGTTIITAQIPGVYPLAGISKPVVVTTSTTPAPGITVTSYRRLGAGLMRTGNFAALASGNHGGVTVRIASGDPTRLKIGPNNPTTVGTDSVDVFVPAGQVNAYFSIHGVENQSGSVSLIASAPGFTNGTASVAVAPPVVSIQGMPATTTAASANTNIYARIGVSSAANPDSLDGFQPLRAGATPLPLTVSNSNASVAQLQIIGGSAAQSHTFYINPGELSTPQNNGPGGLQFDPLGPGSTTVTASAPGFNPAAGFSRSASVSGSAPPPAGISVTAAPRVGSGLMKTGNTITIGGSNAAGVTVRVASSDPTRLKVGPNNTTTVGADYVDIVIPAGQSIAPFSTHGVENQSGSVTLTASASGLTGATTSVTVAPPVVELQGVPSTTGATAANTNFYVRIGVSRASNPDSLDNVQFLRAGAASVPVTVGNSDASVAQLQVIGGAVAQSHVVYINAGQSNTPQNVAGGLQLDPLAAGSTTVTASAPGFNPTAGVSRTVSVSTSTLPAPGISVATFKRIGGGLMKTGNYIQLGASNPAGVTVRVASGDPARLKVGPNNTTTAGTDYVDLAVPAGQSTAYFSMHGVENQTGTVTLTISAPGFANATASVAVGTPVVVLLGVPSNTVAGTKSGIYARIGVSSATNPDSLDNVQYLRAGATPLAVTFSNGNSGVAQLQMIGGTAAQTHTVYINPGVNATPQNVTGALQLDPFAGGSTTVTATAPGFNPVAGFSRTATVIDHDAQYFPIYSGTHAGKWSGCQQCHTTPNNYTVFNCTACHLQVRTDSIHALVSGYNYNNASCYACHPKGARP